MCLGTLHASRCLDDEHDMLTMLAGALPGVCKQSGKVDGRKSLGCKIVTIGKELGRV